MDITWTALGFFGTVLAVSGCVVLVFFKSMMKGVLPLWMSTVTTGIGSGMLAWESFRLANELQSIVWYVLCGMFAIVSIWYLVQCGIIFANYLYGKQPDQSLGD
jgi:hypothetical protein